MSTTFSELFCACDIAFITDNLRDLMYFALNPEDSKDLGKEDVISMAGNQLSIILCLTKMLVSFQDYLDISGLSTADLDQPQQ